MNDDNERMTVRSNDAESAENLQTLTADAFQLAHEYVAVRKTMRRKAGGFLSRFRKIDFVAINTGAIEVEDRLTSLREKVTSAGTRNGGHALARPLLEYVEAQCAAAHLTRQWTDMMLQLSKNPYSISLDDFKEITQKEFPALEICQSTGDRLTTLYRSM